VGLERLDYGRWAERTTRLAAALRALGVRKGDRVGTFAWNSHRHLEVYFAAPCMGAVLHTVNIRLSAADIAYIVNHAGDKVLIVDASCWPTLAPIRTSLKTVEHIIVMKDTPGAEVPDGTLDYEALLADARPLETWPTLSEFDAAGMCYTSGTTGHPKGVVYTHRSSVLHSIGAMLADTVAVSERDVVMPVVPMFHANAWGLAHAAPAAGATLVMPGPDLSGPAIANLIESEKVTVAAGVPTIWMGVLPELKGRDTSSLRAIPCGGSAVPRALSEAYREQVGLPIMQAWGMTETSPVCTIGRVKSQLDATLSDEEKADLRTSVGYVLTGVDFRVVDPNTGDAVPWDGEQTGELQVSGPWIAATYYNDDRASESFTADGWLRTGDVARVDSEGYIFLVDRTKDLVKSGGEWISSAELENEIMAHPKVLEAAVIGVNHPKWSERPLACVVVKPGEELTKDEVMSFLDGRIAKWWMPDDVVFIDEVPKTSVGKFSKKTLRERFADHVLPTA
jgi:fatty-acyl-CoA synthase